jgi:hypothetical protein
LRPHLTDGIAILPKLLPLQFARVFRWRPYQLRAPLKIADGVLDVALGDLRVRRPRSPYRVRVNVYRANAAGPSSPWCKSY